MRMREPQVQACRQILPQQTQCQERHHVTGGREDGSREVRERSGRLPGVLSVQRLLLPTAADGHVKSAFPIATRGSDRIQAIWHLSSRRLAASHGGYVRKTVTDDPVEL